MEFATSADGRKIAYARAGNGPPLVLVHGSLNDHQIWNAVLPAFNERFTTYAMDRRGRGESGPPEEHALERQFEDVLAVIDAAGEPVDLLGHSYGAHCALGAAALKPALVKHLVLYEPPMVWRERLELAQIFEHSDPEEAVENFMRNGIGVTDDQLALLKASPFWQYLVGLAPTMPTEVRALIGHGFDPARFASLTMPALFLQGSQTIDSGGEVMRSLEPHMPQAQWMTFEGHGHVANLTAPNEFAAAVCYRSSRDSPTANASFRASSVVVITVTLSYSPHPILRVSAPPRFTHTTSDTRSARTTCAIIVDPPQPEPLCLCASVFPSSPSIDTHLTDFGLDAPAPRRAIMTTASAIDLFDPGIYAKAMPHDDYARLRREAPIFFHPEPDGPGFWALTKYDDIVTVSTDNTLYSSWTGGTNIPDMPADGLAIIRTIMLNMDPPQHTKYRRLVSTGFTPRMISALEPHVREISKKIVDNVAARGECDFVTEIAAQLPLAVIAEMIGVPPEDQKKVFDWSNRLIGFDDPGVP